VFSSFEILFNSSAHTVTKKVVGVFCAFFVRHTVYILCSDPVPCGNPSNLNLLPGHLWTYRSYWQWVGLG
jgi:hypothetical protein